MAEDRSWMYKRILRNKTINPDFVHGVREFLDKAFHTPRCITMRDGEQLIACPCGNCNNRNFFNRETVKNHLLDSGFRPLYNNWYDHGESRETAEMEFDEDNMMETMIMDSVGPDFNLDTQEEAPTEKARDIYEMLARAEEPLWKIVVDGGNTIRCDLNVLSAITRCLNLKSDFQMSEDCFNRMLSIMKCMLPSGEKLPSNFYEAKSLVRGSGMKYHKIHACKNNCMLYYEIQDLSKTKCDICNEPRFKDQSYNKKGKLIPQKVLRYLPITPRLQRLYMSPSTSEHMVWHKKGIRDKPNLMVHPADGKAWKEFDETHKDFKAEIRNVRLGLSTDGFTPYTMNAAPYTCWPVFVFPYNLPPNLLMKTGTMFLALVIPGPKSPGRDIDVFLKPLVDELKDLRSNGIETYDSFRKENFIMRASLLWTISDFPGYEMLSGWGTHGWLACPICMERTKSFKLKKGWKACWFDCHRMFLPLKHPFRRQRDKFIKNRKEKDPPPHIRSGEEMHNIVMKLPVINYGNCFDLDQIPGYGKEHHWQKRSIFWELPYWSSNLVRHTLDGMHIEKNCTENVLYTCMDIAGKTKDNANARTDMAQLCNRPDLELKRQPGGNYRKLKAKYVLSKEDKKKVCQWLKEIRFPDGYAANWSRCVNVNTCRFNGLKSHDLHVFMERLLPVAFRDFMPDDIWEALTELSNFFRDLCAKEIDPHHMQELDDGIVVTLCKLEKFFPPGFFDSMEHLVVHLAYEVMVCGPMQFHWMYPIERELKRLRKKVGNKAHPEGSIVESYIIEEVSKFCSTYIDDQVRTRYSETTRHDDGGEPELDGRASIFTFSGRAIGKARRKTLDHKDYNAAHSYIVLNCDEIQPYIDTFDDCARQVHRGISEEDVHRLRESQFAMWFRKKVQTTYNIDPHIIDIGLGPIGEALSFNAYDVNGYRFHTEKYGKNKSTVNSGLCVKGGWYDGVEHDYYGIIEEILELQYRGLNNKVVLFKCRWFNMERGIKVDEKHGLVEVKPNSLLQTYEPFVFAAQAIQVYYLPYPSKKRDRKDWWVATKIKAKCSLPNYGADVNDSETLQEEGDTIPFSVSNGEGLDMPNILHEQGVYELVDQAEVRSDKTNQVDEESTNIDEDNDLSSDDEVQEEEVSDEDEEVSDEEEEVPEEEEEE